jgi:hypothetical protein
MPVSALAWLLRDLAAREGRAPYRHRGTDIRTGAGRFESSCERLGTLDMAYSCTHRLHLATVASHWRMNCSQPARCACTNFSVGTYFVNIATPFKKVGTREACYCSTRSLWQASIRNRGNQLASSRAKSFSNPSTGRQPPPPTNTHSAVPGVVDSVVNQVSVGHICGEDRVGTFSVWTQFTV